MILVPYLVLWSFFWARYNGPSHPLIWFNSVWALVLSLHAMGMSGFILPLPSQVLLVIFLSFTALNLACLVFQEALTRDRGKPRPTRRPIQLRFDPKVVTRIFYVNTVVFCFEVAVFRGFPFLWIFNGDPRTYADFGIPTLHGVVMGLNLMFFTYYAAFSPRKNWGKALLSLLLPILTVNRQVIISMFFQWIVAYSLVVRKPKIVIRKILGYGTSVIAVFIGIGLIRTEYETYIENSQLLFTNPILLPFSWVYMYLSMPLQNFSSIVTNLKTLYLGKICVTTFPPSAFKILVLGIERGANYDEEVYKYIQTATYNVSSYLAEVYMDFGTIGLIIFNIILGYCCARIYTRWQKDRFDTQSILYLAIFVQCLILSYFFNMFFYLPIIFQLICVRLIFQAQPRT